MSGQPPQLETPNRQEEVKEQEEEEYAKIGAAHRTMVEAIRAKLRGKFSSQTVYYGTSIASLEF